MAWDNSQLQRLIEQDAKLRKYDLGDLDPSEIQVEQEHSFETRDTIVRMSAEGQHVQCKVPDDASREQRADMMQAMAKALAERVRAAAQQKAKQQDEESNEPEEPQESEEDEQEKEQPSNEPPTPLAPWAQKLRDNLNVMFNQAGYA